MGISTDLSLNTLDDEVTRKNISEQSLGNHYTRYIDLEVNKIFMVFSKMSMPVVLHLKHFKPAGECNFSFFNSSRFHGFMDSF